MRAPMNDEDDKPLRSRLKTSLLTLLQAGSGSLVLATTVLIAPPTAAATLTSPDSLLGRA